MRTEVILGDIHGVFMDKRAVAAAMRVVEYVEPDRIVINGDLADFYTLSKYDKDPARATAAGLRAEAKALRPFIEQVDQLSPDAVEYNLGNHDVRAVSYLRHNAPALHEMRGASVRELVGVPERWNVNPYGKVLRIGKLGVTHGDMVRSEAGSTASAMRRKTGGNLLIGHTHRLGYSGFTDGTGTYGAWESGHLSQPPHYMTGVANWQQGFSVVTLLGGGDFSVELVPVSKGRATFRGEVF